MYGYSVGVEIATEVTERIDLPEENGNTIALEELHYGFT